MKAVVLYTKDNKTTFGLLNSDGKCGSVSCEGCQCSRTVKKISLPSDLSPSLEKGRIVELRRSPLFLLHFALIICLPLAVLTAVRILPVWKSFPESDLPNAVSLGSGLVTFLLMAFIVKISGKKNTVTVHPIQEDGQS